MPFRDDIIRSGAFFSLRPARAPPFEACFRRQAHPGADQAAHSDRPLSEPPVRVM
jgi:hypothetical protein